MTQAILENVAKPSMDNKTYSVNIKGLMKHVMDVLVAKNHKPQGHAVDASNLSSHLQKDLGIY